MQTPYFIYKEKLISEAAFPILYNEVKDKCKQKTKGGRSSCFYALHELSLLGDYGIPAFSASQLPAILKEIRNIVEKYTNEIYDYCLVHIYATGEACIPWHSDAEGNESTICSISLGATRKFRLKLKERKTGYDYEFLMKSGDMIVMRKPCLDNNFVGCQDKFVHCVPVEKKVLTPRINITFRQYQL
jgi:hypothetical protein